MLPLILTALAAALAFAVAGADESGRSTGLDAEAACAAPAAGTLRAPAGGWADSFESGDFSGWSWSGRDDPTYAGVSVVRAARAGIPPLDGPRIARFETLGDEQVNAKLYEGFPRPRDVSGTYSTWFFLPRDYRVPPGTWVNLFQFKEKYRVAKGGDTSDPAWWVQLGDLAWAQRTAGPMGTPSPRGARTDQPVAFVNRWNNDWKTPRRFVTLPLGRWFEIRAEVRQGDRIDFCVGGERLDTVLASEAPVGPRRGEASLEWIFGVGNYSTGANGPLYADRSTFVPES